LVPPPGTLANAGSEGSTLHNSSKPVATRCKLFKWIRQNIL
jgi:hypothetical protein